MDEQTSFEARAVLAPRRARMARLALLVPVVAFAAIAWAGISGGRADQATAEIPNATVVAAPSLTLEAPYPDQVVGLDVRRLGDVPLGLGRDEVMAVAGWYVATATTDCPPLAVIYRDGSLPEIRRDVDSWAYCDRSGVLYESRPNLEGGDSAGLPAVPVTLAVGIVVPPELEVIGKDATEVVVVGRFVESGDGCHLTAGCNRALVVDHVAWTPGA